MESNTNGVTHSCKQPGIALDGFTLAMYMAMQQISQQYPETCAVCDSSPGWSGK
jgi:hypothetical protein